MKISRKHKWGKLIHSGLLMLSTCGLMLSHQATRADGAGNADTVLEAGCMLDVYNAFGQGGGLNCTANDVSLATATNIVILDDGCAFPGDTVEFTADFQVEVTAGSRNDVGIYISLDGDPNGDGALTGACTVSTPAYAPTPDWLDLDGTGDDTTNSNDFGYCSTDGGTSIANRITDPMGPVPCDGGSPAAGDAQCVTALGAGATCEEFGPGIQDTCGDISKPDFNPLFPSLTQTVTCVDDDGDGRLDLPYCTSWRQSGANELCTTPLAAYPGAPSKCNCDPGFSIEINVPGQIIVDKVTDPANDPTSFDFTLSGPDGDLPVNFSLTDQAAPFESPGLDAGTYSVTEATNPAYSTTATCDDGSDPSAIDVQPGEIVTCTFTNTLLETPTLGINKPAPTNADEDGSGDVSVGDTLTYTITATNTSTFTTLTNVVVSDSLITPTGGTTPCASVAPGGTCTLIGTYVVTQADVDVGNIHNEATADSDETDSVMDLEDVPVPTPSLIVDKPAPTNADEDGSGDVSVGDTLTYTITATNDGDANLTNVVVSDSLITPTGGTTPCALVAPGGTCTLIGTYVVTAGRCDGGPDRQHRYGRQRPDRSGRRS